MALGVGHGIRHDPVAYDADVSEQAYFVSPPEGPGRGVLVLTSWWGLTSFFRRFADRLSDEGYTVLVPDITFGETFDDPVEARDHLAAADPDRLAALTLQSARLLHDKTGSRPISVVGFSMGASLGLWASVRLPDTIDRVAAFYGAQTIDFDGATSRYQLHMVADDPMVHSDESVFMEATMGLVGLEVESYLYPDVGHWFFEEGSEGFDREAASAAWERLRRFLAE
jgi:dienelactone hydrolase